MQTPTNFPRPVRQSRNKTQHSTRFFLATLALLAARLASAQAPFIQVSNNIYSAYRTDLTNGAWVYVDADSAGATPVRALQRSLGYREVDYKSAVPGTLYFSAVAPATNGATVIYDYTAQGNKVTNLVGFWASKDAPVIIGPDGNPYIADGHHTTAGYLAPLSPVRQLVPGRNRVILGHVLANYYNAVLGPQPVTDGWWQARAAENHALLYGPEGDQRTQPGEPNYATLQPILPSSQAMPASPSNITTNGATAMTPSAYRSLGHRLALERPRGRHGYLQFIPAGRLDHRGRNSTLPAFNEPSPHRHRVGHDRHADPAKHPHRPRERRRHIEDLLEGRHRDQYQPQPAPARRHRPRHRQRHQLRRDQHPPRRRLTRRARHLAQQSASHERRAARERLRDWRGDHFRHRDAGSRPLHRHPDGERHTHPRRRCVDGHQQARGDSHQRSGEWHQHAHLWRHSRVERHRRFPGRG